MVKKFILLLASRTTGHRVRVRRDKISDLLLEKVMSATMLRAWVSTSTCGGILEKTMPGTTDFVLYEVSDPRQRVVERVRSMRFQARGDRRS